MAEGGRKSAPGRPAEKGVASVPHLSVPDDTPIQLALTGAELIAPKSRDQAAKMVGVSARNPVPTVRIAPANPPKSLLLTDTTEREIPTTVRVSVYNSVLML